MKNDISNRSDIELLINTFYDRIKTDEVIGYFFTDVAQVDWNKHLPKMYDFWENALFGSGNYSGNPMLIHKQLMDKSPLNHAHFEHWITLFHATVNALFEGEKAERIKQRAQGIASLMKIKILI